MGTLSGPSGATCDTLPGRIRPVKLHRTPPWSSHLGSAPGLSDRSASRLGEFAAPCAFAQFLAANK